MTTVEWADPGTEVLVRLELFANSPQGVLLRLEQYARRSGASALRSAPEVAAIPQLLQTTREVVQLGWLLFSCTLTAVVTVSLFAVFPSEVALPAVAALAAVGIVVKSEGSHWPRWWLAGVVVGLLLVAAS